MNIVVEATLLRKDRYLEASLLIEQRNVNTHPETYNFSFTRAVVRTYSCMNNSYPFIRMDLFEESKKAFFPHRSVCPSNQKDRMSQVVQQSLLLYRRCTALLQ
jgi:hypothetical protein